MQNEEDYNNPAPDTAPVLQSQNSTTTKKSKLPFWMAPIIPLAITTLLFVAAQVYTQVSCNQLAEADRGECAVGWLWLGLMPLFIILFVISSLIAVIWGVKRLNRIKQEQGAIQPTDKNPGEWLGLMGFVTSFFIPIFSIVICLVALRQSRQAGHNNLFAWAGIIVNLLIIIFGIYVLVGILGSFRADY